MAKVKIFFLTEMMSCGEAEDLQTFTVNQLMPAGSMLVALEGEEKAVQAFDVKGTVDLVPGKFVELSSGKRSLLATEPGYPSLSRKRFGSGEKLFVDLEPLVLIGEDGWTVKMTLYPPLDGTMLPDIGEILALLAKKDVRWGVREKNIAACIAAVKSSGRPQKNQVIARGRLPVNGENARLRVDIVTGEQAGKELGDGRIDFHERRLFVGVDKGQLLATKVSATAGIPGVNIYGQEIPQIMGRDLTIKTGEDILFDTGTGEVRAAFAGVLSVVSDSCVRITDKHVISGDIDFHTGNIDSRAAVEIGGSVNPGFTVIGGGDVLIGGSVESAHVVSHGNVVIQGGITGKEALVEADGDVEVPVIGNGRISCQGGVTIAREAYYAEIKSLHDITFAGPTKVVGSTLFAGGSITVTDVDTETSPNSMLAVATVPERYSRYQKLLKDVMVAQTAVDNWLRRFGATIDSDNFDELQEELDEAKKSLNTYNLVPGAGERDKAGGVRYACRQKITVGGAIQAGAVIRIGNTEATLQKLYKEGVFALNSDTGQIEFHAKKRGPLGEIIEVI
ncbi:MAG TPA: hypothetical protein DDY32_14840 [Desulfobulbaceae bacterium]|nr:hypothetical protein [Desulfobulbaceae bacterium]